LPINTFRQGTAGQGDRRAENARLENGGDSLCRSAASESRVHDLSRAVDFSLDLRIFGGNAENFGRWVWFVPGQDSHKPHCGNESVDWP
jgi:hypothetical protein